MWLFISKSTLLQFCNFFTIKTFYLAFSAYNRKSKRAQKIVGKETRKVFAKTEAVDLSDPATFVTIFLLFYVVPLLWINIYRRGNYI